MSSTGNRRFTWQWPHFLSVVCLLVGVGLLVLLSVRQPTPAQVIQAQTPQAPLLPVAAIPVIKNEYLTASVSGQPISRVAQTVMQQDDFVASLSARALYVLDVDSATPLLAKNPDVTEYPASTTKLMTALVARQHYELAEPITITSRDTSFGTIVGIQAGEVLTVKDLLAAVVIRSGNDAAVTLANHYPGGAPAFVNAMNQLAGSLHLQNTTFINADGLDMADQRTTARDLSILARQVILDPVLSELAQTKTATITDQSGISHQLQNTNHLLGVEPGVIGLKTGTTEQAGEVLITLVERDNRRVLIVLMGSQNRYDETKAILRWIFSHYEWLDLATAQQLTTSHGKE